MHFFFLNNQQALDNVIFSSTRSWKWQNLVYKIVIFLPTNKNNVVRMTCRFTCERSKMWLLCSDVGCCSKWCSVDPPFLFPVLYIAPLFTEDHVTPLSAEKEHSETLARW